MESIRKTYDMAKVVDTVYYISKQWVIIRRGDKVWVVQRELTVQPPRPDDVKRIVFLAGFKPTTEVGEIDGLWALRLEERSEEGNNRTERRSAAQG